MTLANPKLSDLITRKIGDGWISQTDELKKLEPLAEDAEFRQEWRAVKQANKEKLAGIYTSMPASSWIPPGCSIFRLSVFMNTSVSISMYCTSSPCTAAQA